MYLIYGHKVKDNLLRFRYDFETNTYDYALVYDSMFLSRVYIKGNGYLVDGFSFMKERGWVNKLKVTNGVSENHEILIEIGKLEVNKFGMCKAYVCLNVETGKSLLMIEWNDSDIESVYGLQIQGYDIAYDLQGDNLDFCSIINLNNSLMLYAFILNHELCFEFCRRVFSYV